MRLFSTARWTGVKPFFVRRGRLWHTCTVYCLGRKYPQPYNCRRLTVTQVRRYLNPLTTMTETAVSSVKAVKGSGDEARGSQAAATARTAG